MCSHADLFALDTLSTSQGPSNCSKQKLLAVHAKTVTYHGGTSDILIKNNAKAKRSHSRLSYRQTR